MELLKIIKINKIYILVLAAVNILTLMLSFSLQPPLAVVFAVINSVVPLAIATYSGFTAAKKPVFGESPQIAGAVVLVFGSLVSIMLGFVISAVAQFQLPGIEDLGFILFGLALSLVFGLLCGWTGGFIAKFLKQK